MARLRRLEEKADFAASAPKGASNFEGLMVSLKRYPDTKPGVFPQLVKAVLFRFLLEHSSLVARDGACPVSTQVFHEM